MIGGQVCRGAFLRMMLKLPIGRPNNYLLLKNEHPFDTPHYSLFR